MHWLFLVNFGWCCIWCNHFDEISFSFVEMVWVNVDCFVEASTGSTVSQQRGCLTPVHSLLHDERRSCEQARLKWISPLRDFSFFNEPASTTRGRYLRKFLNMNNEFFLYATSLYSKLNLESLGEQFEAKFREFC